MDFTGGGILMFGWGPMGTSGAKKFTATLEAVGTQLRWVVARVPFDIAKAWPELQRRRVRGEIEGFAFRTSLFPNPRGTGHILLVNKKMQAAANAKVGQKVRITLQPDLEERPIFIPPELAAELKSDRKLRRWFDALSPSMRRYIGDWADEPKGAETRRRRAEKIAERMFQAMEGEEETPPILRVAFQREPRAQAGWNALTPTQRRNHLLGIFYYENVEARERRAEKAIEDALRAAEKPRRRSGNEDVSS